MARRPEPRWYESRGAWYCWVKGRQVRLAVGRESGDAAWKAFHRLMLEAEPGRRREHLSFEVLADLLLDWSKPRVKEETFEWYVRHLSHAATAFGKRPAHELRPADVELWLARRKGWCRTTKHGAAAAVKRVFRWARRQGLLDSDPMEALEKPTADTRRHVLTPDQGKAVIEAATGPFRDLLVVMHRTGMRPSEAYRLEAGHVDWARGVAVLREHKTDRTGRPRIVILTPVLDLLRPLAGRHPEGPILRNSIGRPWTRKTVSKAFRDLRRRTGLGREATADSFRHLFVTDALAAGVPIATVAQLVGHTSSQMISRTYSHLHDRFSHLQEAASRVRGADVSVPAATPPEGVPPDGPSPRPASTPGMP